MRVFLTRDFLNTGVIEEANGHRMTGHEDQIMVSGKGKDSSKRIYKQHEWYPTMELARWNAARKLAVALERIQDDRRDLDRREAKLIELQSKFNGG